jgi:hypothetical protein
LDLLLVVMVSLMLSDECDIFFDDLSVTFFVVTEMDDDEEDEDDDDDDDDDDDKVVDVVVDGVGSAPI